MGGACATGRQVYREGFLEGVVKYVSRDGKAVCIFARAGKIRLDSEVDLPPTLTSGDTIYCLVEAELTVVTHPASLVCPIKGHVSRPNAAGYYLFQPETGSVLVLPLSVLLTSFAVATKPVDCILTKSASQLHLKVQKYNPFGHYAIEENNDKRLIARYRSGFEDTRKVNDKQLKQLGTQYAAFRRVKKDGNSLYRCIFTQFLEHLSRKTTSVAELDLFISQVDSKLSYFAMLPDYQVYADRVSSVLHKLRSIKLLECNEELPSLQWVLQDTSVDLALVNYLRLLVANFTALHYRSSRLKRFVITDIKDVVRSILTYGQEADSIVKYIIPDLLKVILVQQDVSIDCDEVFETLYAPEDEGRYPVLHVCKSSAQAYHILYSETQQLVDGYDLTSHTYDLMRPSDELVKVSEALYRDIGHSGQHAIQT